jgi:hypothetical protein
MDAINTKETFAEAVRAAVEHLRQQLVEPGDVESTNATLEQLFEQGIELGLTEKEIAQQLIAPVVPILRPGLNR